MFCFQVELHVHLDGAVRIQTIIDLAKYDTSWHSGGAISVIFVKSSFIEAPAFQPINNLVQAPNITKKQSHKHCAVRIFHSAYQRGRTKLQVQFILGDRMSYCWMVKFLLPLLQYVMSLN